MALTYRILNQTSALSFPMKCLNYHGLHTASWERLYKTIKNLSESSRLSTDLNCSRNTVRRVSLRSGLRSVFCCFMAIGSSLKKPKSCKMKQLWRGICSWQWCCSCRPWAITWLKPSVRLQTLESRPRDSLVSKLNDNLIKLFTKLHF